jgi:cytochrome c553
MFDHKAFRRSGDRFYLGVRDKGDMPFISAILARPRLGRGLFVCGALGLLMGTGLPLTRAALAQNIDEGKSAPQLFAGNCATCHRSPNVLGKGRMTPTLFLFLQDHYTTSKTDAWALSSYLASVDTSGRSRGSAAPKKRRSTARPPAAVPN